MRRWYTNCLQYSSLLYRMSLIHPSTCVGGERRVSLGSEYETLPTLQITDRRKLTKRVPVEQ